MATQTKEADFRTCPVTTLQVHRPAELLITANAVTAVVFLTVGGILALLLALTRWQAVHLLSADWFYTFLTAHGITMLVFWIVFFEVAGLYFGSSVLLNGRLVAPKVGWVAFGLMLAGALLAELMIFTGQADVMFTAYVPLEAHPLFYLGIILFAVGALVAVYLFFASVVVAKHERRHTGSLPLVTFGLVVAAIIAAFTLISGAITFIPAFFWSVGLLEIYDPAAYRLVFWAFGHSAQQINLAAMVAIWYALATLTVGATPINEKLSRMAFLLYILFINLGSIHHLMVDPGLSVVYKLTNTSYIMYLAVLGSMIHAYSIPAAVEVAQRAKGYSKGLFQWLWRAPWGEPGFSALVVSMVLFGFLGGVSGVIQGMMQLNMMIHNTIRVVGHFHATVVGGTTVAFMGLTYYIIPLIMRRDIISKGLARIQPYVYGSGLFLLIAGMMLSGDMGVP
ncbi:MAG: cbb3-type cytochrome c oxidase subunit I, partial [Dehalococcoidia bacterium]|nr:cbb3-type cytochrome c oxidase subunit I [Dehalococcoidia bacterium]